MTTINITVAVVMLIAIIYLLFKLNIIKVGDKRKSGEFTTTGATDCLSGKFLDPKVTPALLNKKILLLKAASALSVAEKLHNSLYSLFGYSQNETVGILANLKSKTQVSQVAQAYEKKYNSSLRTDLNDRLWSNVLVDYKTQVYKVINDLPLGVLNDKGIIIK